MTLKCNNISRTRSLGILSSMFLSMTTFAIEDPLKGFHNMSPHDDLLYNSSYFDLTTNSVNTRIKQSEILNPYDFTAKQSVAFHELAKNQANTETGSEVLAARLFSTLNDATVALVPNANQETFSVEVYDKKFESGGVHELNNYPSITEPLPVFNNAENLQIDTVNYYAVKADFTGNGTEEVIAIGDSVNFNRTLLNSYGFHFVLIKANDVKVPAEGVSVTTIYEPETLISGVLNVPQYGKPVVGDLTGDDNQEIVFASNSHFNVFTVCSGQYSSVIHSVCNNNDGTSKPAYTVVNNGNMNIQQLLPDLSILRDRANYDLQIGNFRGKGNELAVVASTSKGPFFTGWKSGIYAYQLSADENGLGFVNVTSHEITDQIENYSTMGGYCFAASAKKFVNELNDQLWLACQTYSFNPNHNGGATITLLQIGFNEEDENKEIKVISKSVPWGSDHWRLRGLSAFYPMTLPTDQGGIALC
ncbi:hypothetical protein [Shewanella surugensis]|uniref:Hemolysin n=1 Tax=Shewanella surugensis TaxID=212020 RepID=A0ABT0LKF9_9GAMM|nr:hypothetical protein [Shewanella surugensis]MCL1127965.1 hypothetical protein [Shewanella surugensis]